MRRIFWVIVLLAGLTVGEGLTLLYDSPERLIKQEVVKRAEAVEATSTTFAWYPNRPGIKRAQIALGRAATLRFEFFIKGRPIVSQVKFGIPKKYADMGVKIEPKEVAVSEGKASSKAIFTVPPGMPLGKFDVLIVAVDAKTGEELGRGEIPIMLLPAGVGGC
ncbi:MAG: hypothetical protein OHK0032_08950 [Thermodesulfovibrionales bacterium]